MVSNAASLNRHDFQERSQCRGLGRRTCSGSNAASSVDSTAGRAADTSESSLGQALAKAYSTACRVDSPSDSSLTGRLALSLRPFPTRCLIDCKRKAVVLVTSSMLWCSYWLLTKVLLPCIDRTLALL